MTTVYNQHTYTAIFVGQTGHSHSRASDDGQTPMAIDCAVCEPFLVKDGWVYNTELVPLTDAQEREAERLEREGNLAVKQAAEAMAAVVSQKVLETAATKPKTTRTRARKTATVA